MNIEFWEIGQVIPYARNARQIPEKAVTKVAASIKEFGWRQPIVVDRERVVVVGHTRLLAARQLGLAQVPVHIADNLTPAQIKAYRLMDNRSHQERDWDLELLGPEITDLKDLGVDLDLTGFDAREIDTLLGLGATDEEENVVPPLPANPASRSGDLWICGPHRVLCGRKLDQTAFDAKPVLDGYGSSLRRRVRPRVAGAGGS